MNKKLIGIHINSNIDDIINQAKNVLKYKGAIVQLFTKSTSKKAKLIYNDFKLFINKNNMKCVIHASYTINIAQNWNYHSWWLKQFMMEIKNAELIGAFGIVIHLGKQLEMTNEEALNNMYTSLLYVHSETQHINVKIFIETSTGQGSEMCYDIEKLSHFFKKFSDNKNKNISERFGICLDTCHIFSAGYDISNKKKVKEYLSLFDKLIGLHFIKLIHLNDSQRELGSHIDRHANIGSGFIGKESLLELMTFFLSLNVPIILETPEQKILSDLDLLVKN